MEQKEKPRNPLFFFWYYVKRKRKKRRVTRKFDFVPLMKDDGGIPGDAKNVAQSNLLMFTYLVVTVALLVKCVISFVLIKVQFDQIRL